MFSSTQTPGRSLQDDTVELPFVCSQRLCYEYIKLNTLSKNIVFEFAIESLLD
jgi:hypothetical protein